MLFLKWIKKTTSHPSNLGGNSSHDWPGSSHRFPEGCGCAKFLGYPNTGLGPRGGVQFPTKKTTPPKWMAGFFVSKGNSSQQKMFKQIFRFLGRNDHVYYTPKFFTCENLPLDFELVLLSPKKPIFRGFQIFVVEFPGWKILFTTENFPFFDSTLSSAGWGLGDMSGNGWQLIGYVFFIDQKNMDLWLYCNSKVWNG